MRKATQGEKEISNIIKKGNENPERSLTEEEIKIIR
jgi:hypothetical protein